MHSRYKFYFEGEKAKQQIRGRETSIIACSQSNCYIKQKRWEKRGKKSEEKKKDAREPNQVV
jgi:hypothetical protein